MDTGFHVPYKNCLMKTSFFFFFFFFLMLQALKRNTLNILIPVITMSCKHEFFNDKEKKLASMDCSLCIVLAYYVHSHPM